MGLVHFTPEYYEEVRREKEAEDVADYKVVPALEPYKKTLMESYKRRKLEEQIASMEAELVQLKKRLGDR